MGGIIQAGNEISNGGFARAAWPNQGSQLARLNDEADILQRPTNLNRRFAILRQTAVLLGLTPLNQGRQAGANTQTHHFGQAARGLFIFDHVAKGDRIKLNATLNGRQAPSVRQFLNFQGDIQYLKDSFKTDHALGKFHRRVGQRHQRPVQLAQVNAESDDGAHGEAAAEHQMTANPVDYGRANRAYHA